MALLASKVSLLLFCVVIFYILISVQGNRRVKRKLLFSKSSRFFFRLNGKDNVLNHTEIFAHGWSFRMNYELPETIPKRFQFFKRDVRSELEAVADDSLTSVYYSCILKHICESVTQLKLSTKCGMFCQIGNLITSSATMEADFFKSFLKKCDYHVENCPYVFKDSFISNG